ncbi:MAG TPA: leucyl aminopeptidase family protein [Haliangium sp.]|nr:leucyl aminopeptidase family protein [Haliangium sp.]
MDLTFARDVAGALSGARSVTVIAPAKRFSRRSLGRFLPEDQARLLADLASDTKPGDLGRTVSTLTGARAGARKLVAGVLPDTVSRYNSPARAESIRRAVKAVAGTGKHALILVLDSAAHQLAAVNAVARAMPTFSAQSKREKEASKVHVVTVDGKGEVVPADAALREMVAMTREAAHLVDMPPSALGPETLAQRARALLGDLPRVQVRELAGKDLARQKLGGIEAVGRAGTEAPRLLVATYQPAKRSERHVALVGKGISFDTGGLHLKPREAMLGMKGDMGGAAAVLGAFRVLVTDEFPHTLSMLLCLAENAIGPGSYKPDDVLTLHSGKTVEINNTDAEGRLVLADGLSYAARVLGADTILDAATLTGAQLVATGLLHAAVVSNDDRLERIMVEAGRASGDLVHPLPFAPELYRQEFKSPVADMRNSVKNRANAQTSCAAEFLHWHIEDCDVTWAHVDLAGPAWLEDRGTGFGVALLAETLRRLA